MALATAVAKMPGQNSELFPGGRVLDKSRAKKVDGGEQKVSNDAVNGSLVRLSAEDSNDRSSTVTG